MSFTRRDIYAMRLMLLFHTLELYDSIARQMQFSRSTILPHANLPSHKGVTLMQRLIWSGLSVLALSSIANLSASPTLALSDRFDQEHQQTLNSNISERFRREHEQTLNSKLNDFSSGKLSQRFDQEHQQ